VDYAEFTLKRQKGNTKSPGRSAQPKRRWKGQLEIAMLEGYNNPIRSTSGMGGGSVCGRIPLLRSS
jgi:hypothetical protein